MLRRWWSWFWSLFAPKPPEFPVATFKDKETAVDTTTSVHDADVNTLKLATSAESTSAADQAAAILDFASSIHAAPGGFVVDATISPPVLFVSPDGQTYTKTPIASITDPVPSPDVPPVAPTTP